MKIAKTYELAEVTPQWWNDLSKDAQKQYIAQHPNSKFVQKIKQSLTKFGSNFHFVNAPPPKHVDAPAHLSAPHSPVRRKASKIFLDKSKALIHNVKEEGIDEWKHFAGAAKSLYAKTPLSHHQKAAIKGLAFKLITVGGPLMMSHPNLHHIGHLLPELAHHYTQDVLLGSLAKALLFAALAAETVDPAEKLAHFILQDFAKYLQSVNLEDFK